MTDAPKLAALADAIDPRIHGRDEKYPENMQKARWCFAGKDLIAASDALRRFISPPEDVAEVVLELRANAALYEAWDRYELIGPAPEPIAEGKAAALERKAADLLTRLSPAREAVRAEALEEAAKLMDDITGEGIRKAAPGYCARGWKIGHRSNEDGGCPKCGATTDQNCPGDLFDSEKVATAIRNLKGEKP